MWLMSGMEANPGTQVGEETPTRLGESIQALCYPRLCPYSTATVSSIVCSASSLAGHCPLRTSAVQGRRFLSLIGKPKQQASTPEKETEMDGATIAPEMKHQACKQHAAQCRRMHSRLENALSRYRTPGEHTSTGWKSAEHAELLLLTTQQCHTISCSALQKAYVELVDACRDTSSLLLPVQATPVKLLCLVAGLGALTAAVF